MKEVSECLTCGSKEVSNTSVRYFVVPGHIMVPNSYLLCEKHKGLNYYFDDIYDENSKRKTIDHDAVIERNKPNTVEFNMAPRNTSEIKLVLCPHEWISVEDRLPEKEKDILICNDEGKVQFGIYSCDIDGDKFFTTNFEQFLLPGTITHWMELPKSPAKEVRDAVENAIHKFAGAIKNLADR